jgi:hypothetical protein
VSSRGSQTGTSNIGGNPQASKPPGDRRHDRLAGADESVVFHVPRELLVEVPVEAEQQVPVTMPGLPKIPPSDNIDIDADGNIVGLA